MCIQQLPACARAWLLLERGLRQASTLCRAVPWSETAGGFGTTPLNEQKGEAALTAWDGTWDLRQINSTLLTKHALNCSTQGLVAYPAACAFSSKHKRQTCNYNGIMHNIHFTRHQHVDAESSVPAPSLKPLRHEWVSTQDSWVYCYGPLQTLAGLLVSQYCECLPFKHFRGAPVQVLMVSLLLDVTDV